LDDIERKIGFGIVVIAAFMGGMYLWAGYTLKSGVSITKEHLVNGHCSSGFHKVGTICEMSLKNSPATYQLYGYTVFALAAVLLLSIVRRRRTLSVTLSAFIGLLLGPLLYGIPFIFYAIWLMLRARRLQKFGVASFSGVSAITRERAEARKEGRPEPELPNFADVEESKPSKRTSKSAAETTPPKKQAEPSKRYTPKKQSGKRR